MEFNIISADELLSVASQIVAFADNDRCVFLFYGEMGAGKTTLVKAMCKILAVPDTVTSPTFSIVNEYHGEDHVVYHFDFYRLRFESEALDMGAEEYFFSGNICFIEWPEKIPSLIPEKHIKVHIKVTGINSRQIKVAKI